MSADVAQLDRELAAQAAAARSAVAREQARADDAEARLALAHGDLDAVRRELGLARAELRWLRRAGLDLNALMERPAVRAARAAGAKARNARSRVTQRPRA